MSLKLDGLFGSLDTFEICLDKKVKETAFRFVHEEDLLEKDKSSTDNINDSRPMLTKQFSKVVKFF